MTSSSFNFTCSHGFELTFLPRRRGSRWQEWKDKEEAKEVTALFNGELEGYLWRQFATKPPLSIVGKADIFRSQALSATEQPHDSWLLEVNNTPFETSQVTNTASPQYQALKKVYSIAEDLNLCPCITRRTKKGSLIEYPTGGGHQHIGLDLWAESGEYLLRLYLLERALCIDYANYPILRWLFSQWSDDVNSAVAVNLQMLEAMEKETKGLSPESRASWESGGLDRFIHDRALLCHSIKQRIAYTGKPTMPTLEFRFFDMPKTMEELVLHTRFLAAWIGYHVGRIDESGGDFGVLLDSHFTLTAKQYGRLTKDMPYARVTTEAFMTKIGIPDVHFMIDSFWDSHYLRRMKYGKAV